MAPKPYFDGYCGGPTREALFPFPIDGGSRAYILVHPNSGFTQCIEKVSSSYGSVLLGAISKEKSSFLHL